MLNVKFEDLNDNDNWFLNTNGHEFAKNKRDSKRGMGFLLIPLCATMGQA